jgi:hypothetical protein
MKYILFLLMSAALLSSCSSTEPSSKNIVIDNNVKVVLGEKSETAEKTKPEMPSIENYNILDVTAGKQVR